MSFRPRLPLALLALVAALGLAACGGDDSDDGGGPGDTGGGESATQLLRQAAQSATEVKSAKLRVALDARAEGGDTKGFPVRATLAGAYQQGADERQVPELSFRLSFSGVGTQFEGGLTTTADAGFVGYQGQDYELSRAMFDRFRQSYEQAQSRAGGRQGAAFLSQLGVDFESWLREPRTNGSADVGGTGTTKITGEVNVARVLDDSQEIFQQLGRSGMSQGTLPGQGLSAEQRREIADAVEDPVLDIYVGEQDRIVRRITLGGRLERPKGETGGPERIPFSLDIQTTDVNQPQRIRGPANPKPFSELVPKLGGLLGNLGQTPGTAPAPGTPSTPSSPGQDAARQYAECVAETGGDAEKAQQCAQLLAP